MGEGEPNWGIYFDDGQGHQRQPFYSHPLKRGRWKNSSRTRGGGGESIAGGRSPHSISLRVSRIALRGIASLRRPIPVFVGERRALCCLEASAKALQWKGPPATTPALALKVHCATDSGTYIFFPIWFRDYCCMFLVSSGGFFRFIASSVSIFVIFSRWRLQCGLRIGGGRKQELGVCFFVDISNGITGI